MACHITEPQHNLRIHTQLFRRYNQYQPFLINLDFDGCEFIAKNKVLSIIVMPLISKYSNFNHNCPVSGYLAVKGFTLGSAFMSNFQFMPGQYYLDVRFYNGSNQTIYFFRQYFTIFEKYTNITYMGRLLRVLIFELKVLRMMNVCPLTNLQLKVL